MARSSAFRAFRRDRIQTLLWFGMHHRLAAVAVAVVSTPPSTIVIMIEV
jgi:hypothetical protein